MLIVFYKVACGDRVFECHQFMLSARSPVFRAMFQSDMTEAQTKRVDIQVGQGQDIWSV